jgi:peroxiredoxin (alkyl hydroperoxide reductase subunit C)
VIADTSHELSAAYGVLLPDGSALRAAYVIDPEGIVRHVPVTDLNVGRNVDETLRVVEALRTGELCPVNWRPGEPTLAAA